MKKNEKIAIYIYQYIVIVTNVTKPVLTGRNRGIYFIFRHIIRTFLVLKHDDYTT